MLSDFSFANKIFDAARIDLDIALRETVRELFFDQKPECTVSLKIKVKVTDMRTEDLTPEFSYSVSTNIPNKSKTGGTLVGDVSLDFGGGEVTLITNSEQTSMLEGTGP